ncbi:MAG: hypothetical protein M1813_009689 [Trichoglossum hirsutum]|nr:MAG: hypothetical protein M1813_009689 [Trichoglossum hirsutum]
MVKPKRSKIRLFRSTPGGPPAPAAVDVKIAHNEGSSVAIEATKERLQASKNIPTPSLSQIIEQKTWENGQLRQELAYQHRKHGAGMYFLEEVRSVVVNLQQVIINFQKLQEEIEDEFA